MGKNLVARVLPSQRSAARPQNSYGLAASGAVCAILRGGVASRISCGEGREGNLFKATSVYVLK